MSTHNICFCGEIRKYYDDNPLIWGCVDSVCFFLCGFFFCSFIPQFEKRDILCYRVWRPLVCPLIFFCLLLTTPTFYIRSS